MSSVSRGLQRSSFGLRSICHPCPTVSRCTLTTFRQRLVNRSHGAVAPFSSSSKILSTSSTSTIYSVDENNWRIIYATALGLVGLGSMYNVASCEGATTDSQQQTASSSEENNVDDTNVSPSSTTEKQKASTPMSKYKLARRNSMRKQKRFYPYVILGAGTTAHAAIESIRLVDPSADILLVSEEAVLPRMDMDPASHSASRPKRSQSTSSGSTESDSQSSLETNSPYGFIENSKLLDAYNEWRRHVNSQLISEPDAYASAPITLLLGRDSIHIDVEKKELLLQDGTAVSYGKCLLASAGKPREFYVLDSSKVSYSLRSKINTCESVHDFVELDNLIKTSQVNPSSHIDHVTVVGGGFLGCEIASALASKTEEDGEQLIRVPQIFVEDGALQRYLPSYFSKHVTKKLQANGIEIVPERLVTGVHRTDEDTVLVRLLGYQKEKLETDYVVLASTHIVPNTSVAENSGLELDPSSGGVVVNASLEAIDGLYVAGNLASYYDYAIGRRRVDMYDHAVNSGIHAGSNMASPDGSQRIYSHQPMFRSQLTDDLLLEGIGKIESSLQTVGVWLKDSNGGANENNAGDDSTSETTNSPVSSDESPDNGNQTVSSKVEEYARGIIYYLDKGKVVGILLVNASDHLAKAREVITSKRVLKDPVNELKRRILIAPESWVNVKLGGRSTKI